MEDTTGNHWNDPPEATEGPDLGTLQNASLQLLNLLRAADLLRDPCLCAESGPLIAVIEASLTQAKALDDIVNDLIDAEAAAWVKT